jgi:ABC-2 type transport system permease protein
MRRAFLIARREYRQHLRTRGFWLGLLLIPAIMVASILLPLLFDPDKGGDAILIADLSGRYQPALEAALERDHQKMLMRRLSIYAQEYHLHRVEGWADWARHSPWFSDAEVEAFVAAGGLDAALAALQPILPANAQPFETPHRLLSLVPFPDAILPRQPEPVLDRVLAHYLHGEPMIACDDGPRRAIAAIVLPEALDPLHPAWAMWTNGSVGAGVIGLITDTIRQQGRDEALATAGVDPGAVARIETNEMPPQMHSPRRGGAVSTNTVRQLIPVGCAWMLWMTIMMVSNVLLHGVIEERSNKLIESLLATVTAHELMVGKLFGVAGIGFTIALTWTVFAVISVSFAPPEAALVLRPALAPYASYATVFGLVFYFVTGYLAIATLFLVIGSMCDSMHDAQAYMTPLIIILLAPLILLRPALSDPHGLLPVLLSWIPIYTPFVMLGRLGTDVSTVEIVSSSLFLVGFIVLELVVAGRIFRASLLRTGQPPRLRALVQLCLGGD